MRDRASRSGLTIAVTAALFTVLAVLGTGPATASPALTRISGTVAVPAGVDAGLVAVVAVAAEAHEVVSSTTLKPDGSYELSGLPPNGYRLKFTGRSGALEQWYNKAPHGSAAEVVTLPAGGQLTGINATLVKGGSISGTLTAPVGVSLTDTKVYDNSSEGSWPVAADGSYKIVGLTAGSHLLWFSGDGNALAQYFNNAASAETATAVTVGEGQDLTGVDAVLRKGASISGTVAAPPGVTLAGIRVAASIPGERGWTGLTSVAADGSYRIAGLAPGQYIVDFNARGTLAQWYSSAASWRTATVLSIAEGQDLEGIDAALVKAASIGGTVTVPPGVDAHKVRVVAYATADPSVAASAAYLQADGSYTLDYLPAGSYTVEFASVLTTEFQGQDSGALVQWYDNADSFDDATAIVLGTGEELTGVHATLVKGASISGSVKFPDAIGDYHTTVRLYASDAPGVALESQVIDHSDPGYVFKGLPAGSYVVGFSTRADDAQSQWWENADTFESASVITVTNGQDVAGIDAGLVKTPRSTAPVTAPDPVTLKPAETAAGIEAGPDRGAAPSQASPPQPNEQPNELTDAGGDSTPEASAAGESGGDGETAATETSGAALLESHMDAGTGDLPGRQDLSAGWFVLVPILVAAAVVYRGRKRFLGSR